MFSFRAYSPDDFTTYEVDRINCDDYSLRVKIKEKFNDDWPEYFPASTFKMMRCSGKLSNNFKYVYENDIVIFNLKVLNIDSPYFGAYNEVVGEVVYSKKYMQWFVDCKDVSFPLYLLWEDENYPDLIGNRYGDNGDILEKHGIKERCNLCLRSNCECLL